jgi:hypothetical protein
MLIEVQLRWWGIHIKTPATDCGSHLLADFKLVHRQVALASTTTTTYHKQSHEAENH